VARYRVEVTEPAEQEIEAAQGWIAVDSPEAAERWSQGIFAALKTLDTMPARGVRLLRRTRTILKRFGSSFMGGIEFYSRFSPAGW
jgi:plasmid stabilization system protein ParE